ncbi:Mg-dependent acid phosphatase NDAI_0B01860 [Naumovozyma dairenensis CBS 421]|uniref:Magnesium-dependent phosphatase-1 n=1 Tax=Naumovozyma dairenensis (strain ATCC 10597 / BCRC 20456 / CBS 421 / NBRC 0211 / NRRL Y-12639) TaxID=1071378 RepID=G0W609_NAUDC|nr:hypothetical protein NDAI_0B01860 [Naumovozyma dairenensis CBS 421]CCD23220.1 hypothetical protein NDAI_0B01860 [Naumovozyma dairenensis CBS 421]
MTKDTETKSYPDVAAFDLDFTVWPCYCDTNLSPPFKEVYNKNKEVHTLVDSCGYKLSFYKDIPKIIIDLKKNGVRIVSASRTWAPEIAKQCLRQFKIEYEGQIIPMIELFDDLQWGERSKIGHLKDALVNIYGHNDLKLLKVCLFDDESRNKDVERYGVKFIYVKDSKHGPSWQLYQNYLDEYDIDLA